MKTRMQRRPQRRMQQRLQQRIYPCLHADPLEHVRAYAVTCISHLHTRSWTVKGTQARKHSCAEGALAFAHAHAPIRAGDVCAYRMGACAPARECVLSACASASAPACMRARSRTRANVPNAVCMRMCRVYAHVCKRVCMRACLYACMRSCMHALAKRAQICCTLAQTRESRRARVQACGRAYVPARNTPWHMHIRPYTSTVCI